MSLRQIFTSRVSGRGNRIGPVFLSVCLSVCPSVSLNDIMTPNNISMAETTMTYTREVRQRWGVFITQVVGRCYTIFLAGMAIAWLPLLEELKGSNFWDYSQSISSFIIPPIVVTFVMGIFWTRTTEQVPIARIKCFPFDNFTVTLNVLYMPMLVCKFCIILFQDLFTIFYSFEMPLTRHFLDCAMTGDELFKPQSSMGSFVIFLELPVGFSEGRGYMNFTTKFQWAILKLEAKMTLLQFFGHISLNNGPI